MSNYTTGELAKLCGITVRTVQYYDTRGILVPSALTEGGRRLYSEEDLQRMRTICFLRELELPINTIAQLLKEEHPEDVIDLLLEEQQRLLNAEVRQRHDAVHVQHRHPTGKRQSIVRWWIISSIQQNRRKTIRFRESRTRPALRCWLC